ncbi:MAG: hypothetical protein M3A24_01020 [Candidatus Rhabdochlamydia oedothoracis]|nr:hypothetical protein [Candidatus Rhabdochlamydia oedothoracis]
MACSVVFTTPSIPLEIPLDSTSSLVERSDDKKGLQSRAVVVLSNTTRNVAVIETIRFLAIVGLICSAVASVLLPALGFAAIAAGACVWKNRVIQLDEKTSKDSAVTAKEVFDGILTRSASTVSRTSQENDLEKTMTREGSTRSIAFMQPITEEIREEGPTDVQEAFLNSLGKIDSLSLTDLHDLLAICYLYLRRKSPESMPKSLNKKSGLKSINTQTYFEKKLKNYFDEDSKEFQNLAKLDPKWYQILQVNDQQKPLEKANPSLIMETVQKLHQKISQEQNKYENETEKKYHLDKAKHAGEYINQLKTFESQKTLHFTEDANPDLYTSLISD